MTPWFLDTSGWIAALFTAEARHEEAAARYQAVLLQGARFVTTNLVVAETHALILRRRPPPVAWEFLAHIAEDAGHEVVFVDRALQHAAIESWVRRFRDQRISVCDAVSFEVMRRRHLTNALALDRHFHVAGFEIL